MEQEIWVVSRALGGGFAIINVRTQAIIGSVSHELMGALGQVDIACNGTGRRIVSLTNIAEQLVVVTERR